MPSIRNVILINILFFSLFAIVGVNLYKGKFYLCDTQGHTEYECLNNGGNWLPMAHNFDDFSISLFSMFSIGNAVGWAATMYRATRFGETEDDSTFYNVLFFIGFIVFGNFFLLNLFVGVVTSTYNREKELLGKNYLLTEG